MLRQYKKKVESGKDVQDPEISLHSRGQGCGS